APARRALAPMEPAELLLGDPPARTSWRNRTIESAPPGRLACVSAMATNSGKFEPCRPGAPASTPAVGLALVLSCVGCDSGELVTLGTAPSPQSVEPEPEPGPESEPGPDAEPEPPSEPR